MAKEQIIRVWSVFRMDTAETFRKLILEKLIEVQNNKNNILTIENELCKLLEGLIDEEFNLNVKVVMNDGM